MDYFFTIAYYHDDLKFFYKTSSSANCSYNAELMTVRYNHISSNEGNDQQSKNLILTAHTEDDFHHYNTFMNTTSLCADEHSVVREDL
jgi:hypothetical protein